ncbi:MAG: class I SAM-dependent methyltransferase [Anaerolineae bacterium]|nr:class I SAM-dependent methyltransferase [Anaerolineae bacterium]
MAQRLVTESLPIYRDNQAEHMSILGELSRLNRQLGLRAMASGSFATGLTLLTQGIGIYRCWALPLVISYFQPQPGTRILDVSSPRSILPIYWALRGCKVSAMDADPRVLVQYKYAGYLRRQELVNDGLWVYVQDATQARFAPESFDIVTCISTIDRLPGNGDVRLMREASRLLRDGGRVFVSFRIGSEYRERRRNWGFCRTYDENAIDQRIIALSGMAVEAMMYFETESTRRFSRFWHHLPGLVRNGVLGWLQKPLFKQIYQNEQATAKDAHYAGMVLRKVGAGE